MSYPNELFHYCSISTMFKILDSKKFWISNAQLSNDSRETFWVKELLDKMGKKEIINSFYNNNDFIPYIGCFSSDDDSLSQWRGYADDGYGVSICFNFRIMGLKNKIPFMSMDEKQSVGLKKVIYNQDEQLRLLEDILKSDNTINIATKLKLYSLIMKNHCFDEEREWRIIHSPLITENEIILTDNITERKYLSDLKFRNDNRKIISYFELLLDEFYSSSLIPKIILGPKSKININELYKYLAMNGLGKTEIYESEASYQ